MKSWGINIVVFAFVFGAVLSVLNNESRANEEEKAIYVGSEVCQGYGPGRAQAMDGFALDARRPCGRGKPLARGSS